MTVEQAYAALRLAPADDWDSMVCPGKKRWQVVQGLYEILKRYYSLTTLDVSPDLAKSVAMAVQDWPDPVSMRFTYNPSELPPADINVGWNHEELASRKNGKREATLDLPAQEPKPPDAKLDDLYRKMQEGINSGWRKLPKIKPEPEQPKQPEPPPDPKSPTFVMKRPKLR